MVTLPRFVVIGVLALLLVGPAAPASSEQVSRRDRTGDVLRCTPTATPSGP